MIMRLLFTTCCLLSSIVAAPRFTEKPARKYGISSQQSEESCNPVVDILFVFDNTSDVNTSLIAAQKSFVNTIIQKHKAPVGTVRIAVSLCGNDAVSTSDFTDDFTPTSDFFETTFKQRNVDKEIHCLQHINSKFKTKARDRVARIAVIFKTTWNWKEDTTQAQTEVAWNENIVMVVVVIGVKDFKSLSALQSIATEDGTFFVVANSKGLLGLADSLGKDACKPISLDLTSKSLQFWNVTQQPVQHYDPCIDLGDGMFKRYIPGFGYIRQQCRPGQVFSFAKCVCIPA